MIRHLISEKADLQSVQQWIVEKDYAISYLLKAISVTADLNEVLVMKGGTALRKLYFKDYRFSEDLDYSTREIGQISDLETKITAAVNLAGELLNEHGPFRIEISQLELRDPHPGGQASYVVRVQFPDHRQPLCRVKVEITIDELVLLQPELRPILHDFPEPFKGFVSVYQLTEIISEKLRALLQNLARIDTRGWGSGRVARDYYDLWYLLERTKLNGNELVDLTNRKSAHRNVQAESVNDFFSPSLIELAKKQWDKQLRIFVPSAPDVDKVIGDIKNKLNTLWK